MSGSNFITDASFNVHLVDLDSLQPINNQSTECNDKCPDVVNQRLWKPNSLNHKVNLKSVEFFLMYFF